MEKAQKGDLIRITNVPEDWAYRVGTIFEVESVFNAGVSGHESDGVRLITYGLPDGEDYYAYNHQYEIRRKAGEEDSTEVSACASCGAEVVEGEAVTPPAIKYDTTYAATDAQIRLANDIEPTDAVNPQHYKQGRVEVIDIIEDAVEGADPFEAVCQANVLKYALRYRHKNGVEDLRKSIWYTEKLIAYLDAKSTQD